MTVPFTKIFNPGEILTASDVNEHLLNGGYQFRETVYFTSSGTFTKADYPWLRAIRVRCVGGGGGGGGAAATAANQLSAASGGASGGYAESFITDIAGLDASVTVTRGAGGGGGAAGNNAGSSGTSSSFGALVSTQSGGPGSGSAVFGTSDAAVLLVLLQSAFPSGSNVGDLTIAGRNSIGPVGAPSVLSGQPAPTSNGNGAAGSLYGSGGGGGANREGSLPARSGGAGANGIVIVDLFG
jgi:hypothetical protein